MNNALNVRIRVKCKQADVVVFITIIQTQTGLEINSIYVVEELQEEKYFEDYAKCYAM